MSKAAAFAYYYPPRYSKGEAVWDLCGVPMLAGSLDEAATLLRIARPYYGAALARQGQMLLVAQPWRPAALWSTFRLRSARDIKGTIFGQPSSRKACACVRSLIAPLAAREVSEAGWPTCTHD